MIRTQVTTINLSYCSVRNRGKRTSNEQSQC